jgi:hypothetical protein
MNKYGPHKKHLSLPVPTQEDYERYTGGHTPRKWVTVGETWRCPSCERTKFEQLTWTKSRTGSGGIARHSYIWLAPIVEHHDHGADDYRQNVIRRKPRFAPTFICFDCNIAEGRLKRLLKLPQDFSFSPTELNLIITGHPHRRVTEDPEMAKLISDAVLRLRF